MIGCVMRGCVRIGFVMRECVEQGPWYLTARVLR